MGDPTTRSGIWSVRIPY